LKIGTQGGLISKVKRVSILAVMIAGTVALVVGCERSAKKVSSQPPLIPETDPLAQPKSLQQVGAPAEMTRAAIPADNPQTPEKISLGQKLFFDRRLSVNSTVSCSTCHDPALAFTDRKPTSVGVQGRVGQRNAPTVLNALYNKTQFWDGRVKTLEEQAALPIVNSVEMGHPNLDAAVAQIAAVEEYQQAFRVVFGRPPNGADLVRAIASYERTQLSFDSPFDHFIAGDKNAIDESAKHGWELFNNQARCNKCHALTDTARDVTNLIDNDFQHRCSHRPTQGRPAHAPG
jgi:cytochrome c peroxidase